MKSKVFFIPVNNSDGSAVIREKLERLLKKSRLLSFVKEKDKVVIKMHFGEEGNTGYIRPEYSRVAADLIKKMKASSAYIDANTLYQGRRNNSKDHLKLAYEHGFTLKTSGAKVLIPDDKVIRNVSEVEINQKYIKIAKVLKVFLQYDSLLGLAHFKGHIMTGFGGALKNIGMGCASREGKLAQHSNISPFIKEKQCIACGRCIKVCPAQAITLKNRKAIIDPSKCIGCSSCIAACKQCAIEVDWESGGNVIQEKMIEYAKAILDSKKKKCGFVNFAIKITKECDCLAKDDPRIAPDVGLFVSRDPVSVDKACFDLVLKAAGRDIFKEAHPSRNGLKQLKYAQEIGIGNLDYELIVV
ncbi:MAG: DUF362 domain-containing protein [Candidatus Omnitrophica bacterium]|nr:DUF362 domain-containing protein [Candidatus Omnitrophota bacterium]